MASRYRNPDVTGIWSVSSWYWSEAGKQRPYDSFFRQTMRRIVATRPAVKTWVGLQLAVNGRAATVRLASKWVIAFAQQFPEHGTLPGSIGADASGRFLYGGFAPCPQC